MAINRERRRPQRYPDELRERAVRMVFEVCEQTGEMHGVIARVARELGIGAESLRNWVARAEIDSGARAGTSSARGIQLEPAQQVLGEDAAERPYPVRRHLGERHPGQPDVLEGLDVFFDMGMGAVGGFDSDGIAALVGEHDLETEPVEVPQPHLRARMSTLAAHDRPCP